jgi:KUP system potassium uptake protein
MQTGPPDARRTLSLALGAVGIVFGDIGTSPLYTLKECFAGEHPVPVSPGNVLGVLSLIFWALTIVVTIKYVAFVMRADNRGEGGDFALMALIGRTAEAGRHPLVMVFGLIGVSLFTGDSMITPAISVLSAVEGLEVAAPALQPYVVPLALGVLVFLFTIQSHGTARVGAWFGPVTTAWFLAIGLLGLPHIIAAPSVLEAVNPLYAARFAAANGVLAFLALGSVVLAITGAEALYIDMGHFGKRPIRLAWLALVFPALVLNYFGQGALLLSDSSAVGNPFYRLAPGWAVYPLVGLATAATVIASQAVISGAFSLIRQAIVLDYWPRLTVRQTSEREIGQIYVPPVNWCLLGAVVVLVLGFRSSTNLAAAYGIAVTGAMVCTTAMALWVARYRWHWPWAAVGLAAVLFLSVDLALLAANALKIPHGGWFPLVVAALAFLLMTTWHTGRKIVRLRQVDSALSVAEFRQRMGRAVRVSGTAVFLTRMPGCIPPALLHNLKHNKVVHERVVLLTVSTREIPRVADAERIEIEDLGDNFWQLTVRFGFMEEPNLPAVLAECAEHGLAFEPMDTSFFISRETLIATEQPGMAIWRDALFAAMARNAATASDFFEVPPNRVIELGTQIEL